MRDCLNNSAVVLIKGVVILRNFRFLSLYLSLFLFENLFFATLARGREDFSVQGNVRGEEGREANANQEIFPSDKFIYPRDEHERGKTKFSRD